MRKHMNKILAVMLAGVWHSDYVAAEAAIVEVKREVRHRLHSLRLLEIRYIRLVFAS